MSAKPCGCDSEIGYISEVCRDLRVCRCDDPATRHRQLQQQEKNLIILVLQLATEHEQLYGSMPTAGWVLNALGER